VCDLETEKARRGRTEDKVDSSELLEHLDEDTAERALEHVTLEAGAEGGSTERELVSVGGRDLGEFSLNELRIDGLGAELGEVGDGFVVAALEDEVTRRLGNEDATDEENRAEEDLESDGHAEGGLSGVALGSEVDKLGNENTDGAVSEKWSVPNRTESEWKRGRTWRAGTWRPWHHECAGEQTRPGTWESAAISSVFVPRPNRGQKTDHHRDESDTETGDDTTGNEATDVGDGSLNGDSNEEDRSGDQKSTASTKVVGDGVSE